MSDHIHQHHRERLRERYLSAGLDGFADHEILEMLLGYTILQKDTNPIAHALIDRFGSLRNVLEADPRLLTEIPQLGEASAFFLKLLPDVTRRYYEELTEEFNRFIGTEQMIDFFAARFAGRIDECCYAAFLDENKRIIQCTMQYEGSISAVEIHTEKLLRAAAAIKSPFIIVAHNHFKDSDPSDSDLEATALLYQELAAQGIELLDHVVICGNSGTSMKESGHFKKALELLEALEERSL